MFILWLMTTLALSVDGLAAGFSLGLRRIRMCSSAKVAIAFLSAGFAAAAIGAGGLLSTWLPTHLGSFLGGAVLIFLGISSTYYAIYPKPAPKPKVSPKPQQFHLLGLTILVLHDPVQGDLDHSGAIDLREALILGISLSVDMLGAGLGLALDGAADWWGLPLFVAAVQTGFLALGNRLGRHATHLPISSQWCEIAAGCILLLLGITRLFF